MSKGIFFWRLFDKSLKGDSRNIQSHFKEVSGIFLLCFKDILKNFKGGLTVTMILYACVKEPSRGFQVNLKDVSSVFLGC